MIGAVKVWWHRDYPIAHTSGVVPTEEVFSRMSQPMPPLSPAADRPPRVLSAQLASHEGTRIRIAGWLHRVRVLKSVAFAIVRDRAGLSQVVVRDESTRAQLESLCEETVIEVEGVVTHNPAAVNGAELTQPSIHVLGEASQTPFDLYRPKLQAMLPASLDHAPVALRHRRKKAAFELAAAAVNGFRDALTKRSFIEVHTPKIVGSATESGANVFALDYFSRPAYLAQSPQFYKQTLVGVFERVFEVGPVFRAEPHDTVRHLAQYTSLDVEFGFIDSRRDVELMLHHTVRSMLDAVSECMREQADALDAAPAMLPDRFPRLHFREALTLLSEAEGVDHTAANDLSPGHERWLGEWARREHDSDFLIVEGYPMSKRPFYTAVDPHEPGYSDSFDLLFRGTELVTGGRRLHRYADYVDAIEARGESVDDYASYLEAFAYGMPPHGGFAIGLERFIASLTNAANIREVTLFPRDLHRLFP